MGKFVRTSCVYQNKHSIHFGTQRLGSASHHLAVQQAQAVLIPASHNTEKCQSFHFIIESLDL